METISDSRSLGPLIAPTVGKQVSVVEHDVASSSISSALPQTNNNSVPFGVQNNHNTSFHTYGISANSSLVSEAPYSVHSRLSSSRPADMLRVVNHEEGSKFANLLSFKIGTAYDGVTEDGTSHSPERAKTTASDVSSHGASWRTSLAEGEVEWLQAASSSVVSLNPESTVLPSLSWMLDSYVITEGAVRPPRTSNPIQQQKELS